MASGGSTRPLFRGGILFVCVALVTQALMVGVTYLSDTVAWTPTNALGADLVEHCLKLDLSFHNRQTPGEWLERINGDVTVLSRFFSQFVIHLLGNGILLIGDPGRVME